MKRGWSGTAGNERNRLLMGILWAVYTLTAAAGPVHIQRDIAYGQPGSRNRLLDAYVPQGEKPHPAVILVHGGGWVGGTKQEMQFLAEPLAEAGFTCFSVGYRLAPEHRWPACLDDVRRAIRWVKTHAAEYRVDPDRIALVGYSAGGHLACMAAVYEPVAAVVGLAAPTDHPADSARRGGLSECMQKLLGRPKEMDQAGLAVLQEISPINHIRSELPAYLLIHGTADQSVPYEQSVNFQASLKAHDVPCKLITLTGATHRISEWEQFGIDYKQQMIDWLRRTLDTHPSQTGAAEKNPGTIYVCADGTGDFKCVQEAVDAVPEHSEQPVVIRIKPGIYTEKIVIPRTKRFLTLHGEKAETTVLTYHLYAGMKDENGRELGTFRTPSVTIEADDFTAEHITFENSAGDVGQAVAAAVLGDRVVFRDCRFLGWQDTLLDQTGRHYYENCTISGHCDFIFGGGTAFFEACQIYCLDASYITAASTPRDQTYGYVFSNCSITGYPENAKTYLGRPWRDDAYVAFLNTRMTNIIHPEGWHNWGKPHREKTSRYYEYNSTGPGAAPQARVDWARSITAEEARAITVHSVLRGDDGWDPIAQTVQSPVTFSYAGPSEEDRFRQEMAEPAADEARYLAAAAPREGKTGLYVSTSTDGLNWRETVGPIFRDPRYPMQSPCLTSGPDGTFHLVWQTDAENPCGIGYARSADLLHWSDPKFIALMQKQKAFDITEPTLFYDAVGKRFLLIWASTLPGNYFQAYQEDVEENPRLWYTATTDFESFSPAKVFFEPGYSVNKGIITLHEQRYALVHEDSRGRFRSLRVSFADSPTGPWSASTDALPITGRLTAVLTLADRTLVYLSKGDTGGAWITQDFNIWTDVSAYVSFPSGFRYGSILAAGRRIFESLQEL